MSRTEVILTKITKGSRHLRGGRDIDYTIIHELYYSYEALYKDKELDRFFIEIRGKKYDFLYVAGGSLYSLLKIMELRYSSLLESDGLNFKFGYIYRGESNIISQFDGYTGLYKTNERRTIKAEIDKALKERKYYDIGFSIESKIRQH